MKSKKTKPNKSIVPSDYFDVVVQPKGHFSAFNLKDIWQHRDLIQILAWRDIHVRYKQTILGILWVVLQPITTMIIFTIFFGKLAKIPSGNLPYALFVLTGLVFWNFFSNALSYASNSLVDNEQIIKKVYFPRIILPIAAIATTCVDFAINLIILLIIALFFGYFPNLSFVLILPIIVLTIVLTALGGSMLLSSINVKYRDVRYALPFIFQILIFVTPVIYPLNIVSPQNQQIMALNPMSTIIEIVRGLLTNTLILKPNLILISLSTVIFLLVTGAWYFQKTERFFADIA